jgi:hypothetical protein
MNESNEAEEREVFLVYRSSGSYDDYRVEVIAAYDNGIAAAEHVVKAKEWFEREVRDAIREIDWEEEDAMERRDEITAKAQVNEYDWGFFDTDDRTYWTSPIDLSTNCP